MMSGCLSCLRMGRWNCSMVNFSGIADIYTLITYRLVMVLFPLHTLYAKIQRLKSVVVKDVPNILLSACLKALLLFQIISKISVAQEKKVQLEYMMLEWSKSVLESSICYAIWRIIFCKMFVYHFLKAKCKPFRAH